MYWSDGFEFDDEAHLKLSEFTVVISRVMVVEM